MRMHTDNNMVSISQVAAKPLNTVSIHIGSRHFHRGRQIKDNRLLRARLPYIEHGLTYLQGKVHFRAGKALGRILVAHGHIAVLGLLQYQLRPLLCQGDNLLAALFKDHVTLQSGGGIVEVDNGLSCSLDGGKTLANKLFSSLGQHLNNHIFRHLITINEQTKKIVFYLRCRRKTNLYFGKTNIKKQAEHLQLFFQIHRLN